MWTFLHLCRKHSIVMAMKDCTENRGSWVPWQTLQKHRIISDMVDSIANMGSSGLWKTVQKKIHKKTLAVPWQTVQKKHRILSAMVHCAENTQLSALWKTAYKNTGSWVQRQTAQKIQYHHYQERLQKWQTITNLSCRRKKNISTNY